MDKLKPFSIILTSHGSFAKGALECAEMLVGSQRNIDIIAVEIESNKETLRCQFLDSYHKTDHSKGVLILADLLGGTPCNLASELAIKHKNIVLYAGFNMPILLETLTNRHLSLQEVSHLIDEIFPESCVNVTNALQQIQQHEIDEL